jgi:hypothetical protein
MTDIETEMSEATFRAPKRRKIFRTRAREEAASEAQSDSEVQANPIPASGTKDNLEDDDPEISVAEILRRRRTGKVRKAGLEFSVAKSGTRSTPPPPQSTALIPIEDDKAGLDSAVNRFMPEMGPNKVTEVTSKHM